MHIIIGLITAAAGLIWAIVRLQNSGFNLVGFLNAINPFFWWRRKQWQQKVGARPLHQIQKPMEAVAVLLVASVKTEGEVSREQKQEIIQLFISEFKLTNQDAQDLFAASAFMLQDVNDMVAEVKNILTPNKASFTQNQAESAIELLQKVSMLDGEVSAIQQAIIDGTRKELISETKTKDKWD
ncbi:hypothetical protein NBRC116493_06550 [Aurantivibrio infirmus]